MGQVGGSEKTRRGCWQAAECEDEGSNGPWGKMCRGERRWGYETWIEGGDRRGILYPISLSVKSLVGNPTT